MSLCWRHSPAVQQPEWGREESSRDLKEETKKIEDCDKTEDDEETRESDRKQEDAIYSLGAECRLNKEGVFDLRFVSFQR